MKQIAWMGAALLAAAANTAWADQLAEIRAKGEVVIGVLGTAEPYSFIDPKTRELVGYEVDLGKELAKALGVKPVFKQMAVAARIPSCSKAMLTCWPPHWPRRLSAKARSTSRCPPL